MYARACSLMMSKAEFFEQASFVNIVNKQIKARVSKVIEKNLDETVTKCMNGMGCQYKDGCALRMNKNVKLLIRKEIKKYGSGADDKRD